MMPQQYELPAAGAVPEAGLLTQSVVPTMAKRRCANCHRNSGTAMKSLVAVNFLAGLCLIIFGSTVQHPIKDFPAVAMILLGVLSWVSALCGLVGGAMKMDCCLNVFVVLHGINTALQMALVICLHVNYDGVVAALVQHDDGGSYDKAHIQQVVSAAKWIMLVFLLCEIASLILAVLLQYVLKPDDINSFDNWDAENQEQRTLTMNSLRTDIDHGRTTYDTANNSLYNKIRGKMASKYGQFSHGIKWKKSWFGFGS
eukprot:jgi/Chrzof1/2014/Cz10g29220.t1